MLSSACVNGDSQSGLVCGHSGIADLLFGVLGRAIDPEHVADQLGIVSEFHDAELWHGRDVEGALTTGQHVRQCTNQTTQRQQHVPWRHLVAVNTCDATTSQYCTQVIPIIMTVIVIQILALVTNLLFQDCI